MASPKKEKPKSRQFRIRMTEEDWQLLNVVAEESGCNKTKVMMTAFFNLLRQFPDEDIREIMLKVAIRMNEIKLQRGSEKQ